MLTKSLVRFLFLSGVILQIFVLNKTKLSLDVILSHGVEISDVLTMMEPISQLETKIFSVTEPGVSESIPEIDNSPREISGEQLVSSVSIEENLLGSVDTVDEISQFEVYKQKHFFSPLEFICLQIIVSSNNSTFAFAVDLRDVKVLPLSEAFCFKHAAALGVVTDEQLIMRCIPGVAAVIAQQVSNRLSISLESVVQGDLSENVEAWRNGFVEMKRIESESIVSVGSCRFCFIFFLFLIMMTGANCCQ